MTEPIPIKKKLMLVLHRILKFKSDIFSPPLETLCLNKASLKAVLPCMLTKVPVGRCNFSYHFQNSGLLAAGPGYERFLQIKKRKCSHKTHHYDVILL